jgi:hypothetical protein
LSAILESSGRRGERGGRERGETGEREGREKGEIESLSPYLPYFESIFITGDENGLEIW